MKIKNVFPIIKSRIKNMRAFTLIEELNAAAIFSIIFVLTFGVFDSSNRLWRVADASVTNQIEVRRSLMDMARKIRGGTDLPSDGQYTQLPFTLDGETVRYRLVPGGAGDPGYIQEAVDGVDTRRLANNIRGLQFTIDTSDRRTTVIIDITAEKTPLEGDTVSFNLRKLVATRNL